MNTFKRKQPAGAVATVLWAALLMGAATVAGFVNNHLSQNGIALDYDWSLHIETQALEGGIRLLDAGEVKKFLDGGGFIVLDARPLEQFDSGHLPTALSAPSDELDTTYFNLQGWLESGLPVITYCSGEECDESLLLSQYLIDQGHTNLYLFKGGVRAWREAGYEVE